MRASRDIKIKGIDDKKIFLRIWDDISNIKGAIQIIHGMAEHSDRYDDFARYLNNYGFIVFADDHRGHGRSEENKESLGYLGEDGFNKIVEDEYIITNFIKSNYDNLPIYIFAHSFGSFIGQEYITRYSKSINGIVLSGSAMKKGLDIKAGAILAKIQKNFIDERREAKFIDKISFGTYNKKINESNNKFAWLTRDSNEVDKYIDDEHCGFISSINFYYNLFNGLNELYRNNKFNSITKSLPILLLSGDMDPVGGYGKFVKELYNEYSRVGIEKVSIKLYEGARHELLNEINKDEVYEYVVNWIETNLGVI